MNNNDFFNANVDENDYYLQFGRSCLLTNLLKEPLTRRDTAVNRLNTGWVNEKPQH